MKNLIIRFFCLPLIALPLLLPVTALAENTAVIPVPREGGGYNRYVQLNNLVQANQGELDLIFIGDSITQMWESTGFHVWHEFYGDRKALNLGIDADRTQHVLWRLQNGNIDGIQPRVVVLLIGTNNTPLDRNTTAETLEGVTAVVDTLRTSLPESKIILLGMFPRGRIFSEIRGKILQVNQALRRLDDRGNIFFLDLGHHFMDHAGELQLNLMPDSLHLSPDGYRIWAEAMEPVIAALLGEGGWIFSEALWRWIYMHENLRPPTNTWFFAPNYQE